MFTLQTTFTQGRGGGYAEVTVNSKEENYLDFWPNYVQEFGLWKEVHTYTLIIEPTWNLEFQSTVIYEASLYNI